MGSAVGVVIQPALGRTADLFGYGPSYLVAGAVAALAIPFTVMARVENAYSDSIPDAERASDAPQPAVGP